MVYDLSLVDNATSLADIMIGIETASNGLFSVLTLASLFIIMVALLLKNTPATSFFTSGLLCTIVSLLLTMAGISGPINIVIYAVISAGSAIAIYKE